MNLYYYLFKNGNIRPAVKAYIKFNIWFITTTFLLTIIGTFLIN